MAWLLSTTCRLPPSALETLVFFLQRGDLRALAHCYSSLYNVYLNSRFHLKYYFFKETFPDTSFSNLNQGTIFILSHCSLNFSFKSLDTNGHCRVRWMILWATSISLYQPDLIREMEPPWIILKVRFTIGLRPHEIVGAGEEVYGRLSPCLRRWAWSLHRSAGLAVRRKFQSWNGESKDKQDPKRATRTHIHLTPPPSYSLQAALIKMPYAGWLISHRNLFLTV